MIIMSCKHSYELNMRTDFFYKYCICYKLCGLKQYTFHSFNYLNPNRDYPYYSLSIQIIKNGSASKSFLTVHFMDINLNPDRKRFRYPGVETASMSKQSTFCVDQLRNHRPLIIN